MHELKLGHKTDHGDCTAIRGMHSEVTMTTVLMCQLSCACERHVARASKNEEFGVHL